jgi:prepilin-type processing-associated H-X9-DG protein
VAIVLASCLGVALLASAVIAALLFPVFSRARDAARRTSCASNLKQISVGLQMYLQDYDETYPPANAWQEGISPYLVSGYSSGSTPPPNTLECPSREGAIPAYAFNRKLAGKTLAKVLSPRETPALFESSLGTPSANDTLESFTKPHTGKGNVGFADGTVQGLEQAPAAGVVE